MSPMSLRRNHERSKCAVCLVLAVIFPAPFVDGRAHVRTAPVLLPPRFPSERSHSRVNRAFSHLAHCSLRTARTKILIILVPLLLAGRT